MNTKPDTCPQCGSAIRHSVRDSTWYECDSEWIGVYGRLVDETDACERIANLRAERDELRGIIESTVSAIDHWKVPMYDPDGKECSEAVMRLLADDLRTALGDTQ